MRHQKKRWFAALLSLCMLLSILPSTSLAFSESEETWSGNRRNQTIDGGTHTITLSNLTIDSPGVEKSAIDITGNADVTFILEGNNTLRGYRNHPAIWWSPVPPLPLKETDYSRPPPAGIHRFGGGRNRRWIWRQQ